MCHTTDVDMSFILIPCFTFVSKHQARNVTCTRDLVLNF